MKFVSGLWCRRNWKTFMQSTRACTMPPKQRLLVPAVFELFVATDVEKAMAMETTVDVRHKLRASCRIRASVPLPPG